MEAHVQEVAENIYQFQVPLPFKLKEINLYLVKADDGCLLIDTGTNTPASAEALQASLTHLGVRFADLRYVALTHFHSDHSTTGSCSVRRSPISNCSRRGSRSNASATTAIFSSVRQRRTPTPKAVALTRSIRSSSH